MDELQPNIPRVYVRWNGIGIFIILDVGMAFYLFWDINLNTVSRQLNFLMLKQEIYALRAWEKTLISIIGLIYLKKTDLKNRQKH